MVKKNETKPATTTITGSFTPEDKEAVLERIKEAKEQGQTFKPFFDELVQEYPSLKAATVYQWFQAASVGGVNGAATVSDRLAQLLRKEGIIEVRIRNMQQQLEAVRKETAELWATRGKTA